MKTGPVLILVPLALMAAGCARPPSRSGPGAGHRCRELPGRPHPPGDGHPSGGALPCSFRRRPARVRADAADIAAVARARLIVVNGAGLESFISKLISNAGGDRPLVEASAVSSAAARAKERSWREEASPRGRAGAGPAFLAGPDHRRAVRAEHPGRPQRVDPAGEKIYGANAEAYIGQLRELDAWIAARSRPSRRKSVCWSPITRALAISRTATGFVSSAPSFRA